MLLFENNKHLIGLILQAFRREKEKRETRKNHR